MKYHLIEYESDREISAASLEEVKAYREAVESGKGFISRGYHGYSLKAVVVEHDHKTPKKSKKSKASK